MNLNIFLEFFTILIFACNFNLSEGNLGLFEKSSIYFIRSMVNLIKSNLRMLLWITVIEFSEFSAKELKSCTKKK